jgi:hypothetical protein
MLGFPRSHGTTHQIGEIWSKGIEGVPTEVADLMDRGLLGIWPPVNKAHRNVGLSTIRTASLEKLEEPTACGVRWATGASEIPPREVFIWPKTRTHSMPVRMSNISIR